MKLHKEVNSLHNQPIEAINNKLGEINEKIDLLSQSNFRDLLQIKLVSQQSNLLRARLTNPNIAGTINEHVLNVIDSVKNLNATILGSDKAFTKIILMKLQADIHTLEVSISPLEMMNRIEEGMNQLKLSSLCLQQLAELEKLIENVKTSLSNKETPAENVKATLEELKNKVRQMYNGENVIEGHAENVPEEVEHDRNYEAVDLRCMYTYPPTIVLFRSVVHDMQKGVFGPTIQHSATNLDATFFDLIPKLALIKLMHEDKHISPSIQFLKEIKEVDNLKEVWKQFNSSSHFNLAAIGEYFATKPEQFFSEINKSYTEQEKKFIQQNESLLNKFRMLPFQHMDTQIDFGKDYSRILALALEEATPLEMVLENIYLVNRGFRLNLNSFYNEMNKQNLDNDTIDEILFQLSKGLTKLDLDNSLEVINQIVDIQKKAKALELFFTNVMSKDSFLAFHYIEQIPLEDNQKDRILLKIVDKLGKIDLLQGVVTSLLIKNKDLKNKGLAFCFYHFIRSQGTDYCVELIKSTNITLADRDECFYILSACVCNYSPHQSLQVAMMINEFQLSRDAQKQIFDYSRRTQPTVTTLSLLLKMELSLHEKDFAIGQLIQNAAYNDYHEAIKLLEKIHYKGNRNLFLRDIIKIATAKNPEQRAKIEAEVNQYLS
jgi:hypothetical protein